MRVPCFNQPGQHARLTRTRPVAWPAAGGFRGPGKQPLPSTSPPAWPFTTQTPPGRQVLAAPLGGLPQGLAIPPGPACPLAADGACSGRLQDRGVRAGSSAGVTSSVDSRLQGRPRLLTAGSEAWSRRFPPSPGASPGGSSSEGPARRAKIRLPRSRSMCLLRLTYIFRCHFNRLQENGH